jgi:hypothetical protein
MIISHEELEAAMNIAVGNAIWRHKRLGEAIVVGRDGKPVTIEAEDIPEEWCIPPDRNRRLRPGADGTAAG